MTKKENSAGSSNTFVATIDIKLSEKIIQDLKDQEFEISQPLYTVFQAKKKGVSCTLYTSGKLTVQGKDKSAFIEFYLEPHVLKNFDFTYQDLDINVQPRIGIDESGKGDFFGPLCIAGVYADESNILKLKSFGVRDSKTMTDANIMKLAKKIQAECIYHIVKINPQKYNELYSQFKNLNSLLAWGHATSIENLVNQTHCQNVIVDQFASEWVVKQALARKNIDLHLEQRHRAEEDLVVAAASILARCTFLDALDKMSKEFGMKFPKGASALTISAGKEFVNKHGREALMHVGKLHFKTIDSI
jgi:ribonuclease HIII